MINENLAKIFSYLKKDDVDFFKTNWNLITLDLQDDFLSYCIEEKAYKVFSFAVSKGLNNIRSIIVANALRNSDLKVLDIIKQHNLFDYSSKKATDLLSISVNNNDLKVIDFLIDKVTIDDNILSFAVHSRNPELIQRLMNRGFVWKYIYPEDNPLVIVMTQYKKDQKEMIDIILKDSNRDKITSEALLYFEDTPEYAKLDELIKKRLL